jgi:hypothetical protein
LQDLGYFASGDALDVHFSPISEVEKASFCW